MNINTSFWNSCSVLRFVVAPVWFLLTCCDAVAKNFSTANSRFNLMQLLLCPLTLHQISGEKRLRPSDPCHPREPNTNTPKVFRSAVQSSGYISPRRKQTFQSASSRHRGRTASVPLTTSRWVLNSEKTRTSASDVNYKQLRSAFYEGHQPSWYWCRIMPGWNLELRLKVCVSTANQQYTIQFQTNSHEKHNQIE
jgi:hypothetical protein